MLVRALSSDCMVERYSVSLKETCGKRKFSVLEAREFIHVRLHNNSPHTCDFSRELGEKDNSGCDFCISWY